MMTRKDYVATAKILQEYNLKYVPSEDAIDNLVFWFIEMFEKDNKRFDGDRFLNAVFNEIDKRVSA